MYKSSKMGGWFFGFTTSVIDERTTTPAVDEWSSGHSPCPGGGTVPVQPVGLGAEIQEAAGWFQGDFASHGHQIRGKIMENREWMEWAFLFSDKPKRIRMKGFGASKMMITMIGYLKLLGNQQTAGPRIKYQIRFGIDWWIYSIDGTSLRPKILVIQEPNYGDIYIW